MDSNIQGMLSLLGLLAVAIACFYINVRIDMDE